MPMPTAIKTSSNRANIIPFSLFLLVVSTLLLLNTEVRSISIDNDIIGEPDIECLDQEIRVWIKTRKYFQGPYTFLPHPLANIFPISRQNIRQGKG
jgi:hypothetical protein